MKKIKKHRQMSSPALFGAAEALKGKGAISRTTGAKWGMAQKRRGRGVAMESGAKA
jgi:hypothetical protein